MTESRDRYGHFSEDGSSYVITTPYTPDTWFNYLFNDEYYMRVSQTGQGRSWVRRPRIRVFNRGFRYFYLVDEDSGECWNLTCTPLNVEPDEYECTHGLGETTIRTVRSGIAAELRVFVPLEGMHEIWTIKLRNLGEEGRRLAVYSVFSFEKADPMGARCAWNSSAGVIASYSFPHHAYYDEAAALMDNTGVVFLGANRPATSVECDQRRFFGCDDVTVFPAAIRTGRCSNLPAEWHDPVGAMQHRMTLSGGQSSWLTLVTGCATSLRKASNLRDRYADQSAVEDALEAVRESWRQTCERLVVHTPEPDLDVFLNYWLKKEIVWETRLWRNGISVPYRNELQDAMGYSIFDPDAARPYLEELVSTQDADGHFKVWNTRPGHKPNHPLVNLVHNDGALWLAICLLAYVDQAGDPDWLDRAMPFKDGGAARVFEHLIRGLEHTAGQRGPHGLVRMRDGDWTDPINGPGRGGKGESVWASMALVYAAKRLLPHCRRRGEADRAEAFEGLAEELDEAINTHAWNGQWYSYGYDDAGRPFGTPEDKEGRIFLNTQTWAIIAGVARDDRLDACLKAIDQLETPCGPRLLRPAFSGWNATVGRLSVKLAGATENGSVYCHGSAFKAFADCLRGDGDAAWDTIRRTLPTNPDNPPERSWQVPIFQANFYFGLPDSPNFGQSSQTLGTGTCTWLMHAAVNYLLGVRATADGLVIDPHLPADWQEATVERTFRGARYTVTIRQDASSPRHRPEISVDGRPLEAETLPCEEGESYDVTALC